MNDFLPKNYEVPNSGDKYYKFEQGDNRFRIMDSPIMGYEYWINEDGSIRQRGEDGKNSKPIRVDMNGTVPPDAGEVTKHFWAMVVWDYKMEKMKILEITQKGVQKSLRALSKDEDWGNPKGIDGYDIVITREGEGLNTEYSVQPKPKKKLDEGIYKLYVDSKINLNALYKGDDPFNSAGTEDVNVDDVKV